jgi:hypothetical protein
MLFFSLHLAGCLFSEDYQLFYKQVRKCVHNVGYLLFDYVDKFKTYLRQFVCLFVCLFVCCWPDSPQWVRASSFTRFLDHTQRRTTVGSTPLDEWSARRRDLYLTIHNTHNRQTSMSPEELTIAAGERPQTYSVDRAATGTGLLKTLVHVNGEFKFWHVYVLCLEFAWWNVTSDRHTTWRQTVTRILRIRQRAYRNTIKQTCIILPFKE